MPTLPIAAALLPLTIFASGCASYVAAPVNLPVPPAYMAPVAKPIVNEGDDARVAWKLANARLAQSRAWYLGVRQRYGQGK